MPVAAPTKVSSLLLWSSPERNSLPPRQKHSPVDFLVPSDDPQIGLSILRSEIEDMTQISVLMLEVVEEIPLAVCPAQVLISNW